MFERKQICLNGYWDFSPADGTLRQKPEKWDETKILVPCPWNINAFTAPYMRDYGNEKLFVHGGDFNLFPQYPKEWEKAKSGWYRTEFFVPEEWKGKTVTLRFDAVNYYSEYYVNGKLVHTDRDGFLPVEFPVSDCVNYGASNTLLVGAVKMEQFLSEMPDGSKKYEFPTGSFWGEQTGGIWQDVFLKAYPDVYIADVFVRTDIGHAKLAVSAELSQARGGQTLDLILREYKGGRAFTIARGIPASDGKVEFEYDYCAIRDQIKLWWPDDPSLYYLDAVLYEDGQKTDVKTVRFGFRSFEVKGNKFHLNGIPCNLRNDSWHYMGFPYQTREYARLWYKMAKEAHANHIRLHAQVYPEFFLDVADEMGMLITDETATWGSHCRYHYSMEFVENCKRHTERMIKRDRNHPSVVIWNVDNECVMAYMVSADNAVKDEAELNQRLSLIAEHARQFDNTRPICADGCRDYDGRLEVCSIHYPGRECGIKTDKPISIGEMGSMYYSTPDSVSSFTGEKVFLSFNNRLEAIGRDAFESLKQQRKWAAQVCIFNLVWYGLEPLPFKERLLSYGDYNAPGVKPQKIGPYIATLNAGYDPDLPEYIPNPVFKWTQAAYIPERFFYESSRLRYYSGEKGSVEISVFNDSLSERNYTIEWSVAADKAVIFKDSASISLSPACYKMMNLAFDLPQTDTIRGCELRVSMKNGGEPVYEESLALKVYNKQFLLNRFSKLGRVAAAGLMDDGVKAFLQGSPIGLLEEGGDARADIVILAGPTDTAVSPVRGFIHLTPAQSEYAGLLTHSSVEKAFLIEDSLLKQDLDENDLYGWNKGPVSEYTFTYGADVNAHVLAATGSGVSLIMDTARENGRFIISCLDLLKAAPTEPAALVLLYNLASYMAHTRKPEYAECVVISKEHSPLMKFLRDIRASVRMVDCEDEKAIRALKGLDTVIVDGRYPAEYIGRMLPENAKRLVIWDLMPENIPACLKSYIDIVGQPLNQLIKVCGGDPVIRGLTNADLYGLEAGNETMMADRPIAIRDTARVEGILKNADLNWRMWNHQSEQIKTAAILRSSLEHKEDRFGLARTFNNGVEIILNQLNYSRTNRRLRRTAITLLNNFGVGLDIKFEDDFEREIHDGLYDGKVLRALRLEGGDSIDPAGLYPGINKQETCGVWNIAPLGSRARRAGVCLYGLYVYSESDRTDLLLNPDLVSMQVDSEHPTRVYLNGALISDGIGAKISAMPFLSGWNCLVLRVEGAEMPVVTFIRKDNDLLDLKFSLEPANQAEIRSDKWVLETNYNSSGRMNAIRGKGYAWSSGIEQKDGIYFMIDLGAPHHVSRVQFTGKVTNNGSSGYNTPRSIRIMGSGDGSAFEEIYSPKDERQLSFADGKCIFHLDSSKTRYLRLELTNVALKPWTISELKVFETL